MTQTNRPELSNRHWAAVRGEELISRSLPISRLHLPLPGVPFVWDAFVAVFLLFFFAVMSSAAFRFSSVEMCHVFL
jgi:hypothetical protein